MIKPAENDEMAKDTAAPSCESELKELQLAWKSANREFRDTVYGAIKDLQARSNDLNSQRTKSLEQLRCEHPHDANELSQVFIIPNPMRGTHICGDLVFSYHPNESSSNLLCDSESDSQAATSETRQPVLTAPPMSTRKRKHETYHNDSSIAGTPSELPKRVNAENYKNFLDGLTPNHYLAIAFMMMEQGGKMEAGKPVIDLDNNNF